MSSDGPRRKRPRSRIRRALLTTLVVICLLAILAAVLVPVIASSAFVRRAVFERISRQIDGRIDADSWSVSWRRGVHVKNLSVTDAAGVEVASVPSAHIGLSWLSLPGKHIDLGKVLIEQPRLHLDTRKAMLGLPAPVGPESRPAPDERRSVSMRLVVKGASAEIAGDAASVTLDELDLDMTLAPGTAPLAFSTDFKTRSDKGEGSFHAEGSLTPKASGLAPYTGEVSLDGSGVDLRILNAFLVLADIEMNISGVADLSLRARLEEDEGIDTQIEADLRDLFVSGKALRGDVLALPAVDLAVDLSLLGGALLVERLDLESDVLSISAKGALGGADVGFDAVARMDVAALGNMLPATLRLTEGTKLTGGQLDITVGVGEIPDGWRAAGKFDLSGLAGRRGETAYSMSAPVGGEFVLRREGENFTLERAAFASSFGQGVGATEGRTVTLTSELDLATLQAELGQFIDLKGVSLSGRARSTSSVDMTNPQRLRIESETSVSNLLVTGITDAPIDEKQAGVVFSGVYSREGAEPRIDIDRLDVSGSSLWAKMSGVLQKIDGRWDAPSLAGSVGGRLDVISKLLSGRLGAVRMSGAAEVRFRIESAKETSAFSMKALASDLALAGLPWGEGRGALRSGSAEIELDGVRTMGSPSLLDLESFNVKTDFAELAGSGEFHLGGKETPSTVSVESLKCDLAGLCDKTDALVPAGLDLAGALEGSGRFSAQKGGSMDFDATLAAKGARVLESATGKVLFDDNLTAELAGAWSSEDGYGRLDLARARISTDSRPDLVRLADRKSFLRTDGAFSLEGELAIPLELIQPVLAGRLAGYSGKGEVRWNGKASFEKAKALFLDGKLSCLNLDLLIPREGKEPLKITEPRLDVDVDLDYAFATSSLRVDKLAMEGADFTLSCRLLFDELGKEPLPSDAQISADVQLAPFLERYGSLLPLPEGLDPSGRAKVEVKASTSGKVTKADGKVSIEGLALGKGEGRRRFDEGPVDIQAKISVDRAKEHLDIESLRADSPLGDLEAKGVLARYRTGKNADIELKANCDLAAVANLLRTRLPEGLSTSGAGRLSLAFEGSLAGKTWRRRLAGVKAQGRAGFDKIIMKGLSIGPMDVPFELAEGLLHIAHTSAPLNEGTLRIAGTVDLMQDPPLYELSTPITVAEGMRLSRDVEFIRFLTPIFGNLAEIDGRADLDLDFASVALSGDAANTALAAGEVRYRNVVVRESLLLLRLFAAIGGIAGGIEEMSPTRFEIADGRVHIDETTVRYAGQSIAFGGSVGFDRTLDILVRVLITERLLGKNAGLMEFLVGEKVGVPITGNLDDPKVGEDILQKNLGTIVKGALKRTLDVGDIFKELLPLIPQEKE